MASSLIKIENLNFYYDYKLPTQTYALKDINFEVNQGEYVVFFGPSGCGKTTLIYLIGGINTDKNGTGKILVNDRDVFQLSRDDLTIFRQTGIGIIFQNFNLIPSLTVLDNVALPMTFIGVPQDERRAEAMKLLARLNMEEYAQRFPTELSGGQQQRVGIARALANNPPIIIADEPLGNLDSENAEHVLKFLKELQTKDGRTVIMVTHEAWSVRDADRIIYLKDGSVVKAAASADEIQSEAATQNETLSPLPLSPKIFRELYPDLTQGEIMVKSLANLLLRGFSADEIKRFEFYLDERLAGKIDADTFEAFLNRPFHKEGVGLWKQRALKVAQVTEEIISQKKQLTEVYHELEKNPETPLLEVVHSLKEWILKEYHGHVSDLQHDRLNEAITARLRGSIDADEFRRLMNLSRTKGGMGFSIRSTQHACDRLESVLALGHPTGDIKEAMKALAQI